MQNNPKRLIIFLVTIITVFTLLFFLSQNLYQNMRFEREKNVLEMLRQIHEANFQYRKKNRHFLSGLYSLKELNQQLGLSLAVRQIYFFFEESQYFTTTGVTFEFQDKQDNFEVLAAFYKPGSAFFRDMFTLKLTGSPMDSHATVPNPCCVDEGLCPSINKCVLGK